MKQLYRIESRYLLNGIELCSAIFVEHKLHYGEVPESDVLEVTSFDEAWNKCLFLCSNKKNLF